MQVIGFTQNQSTNKRDRETVRIYRRHVYAFDLDRIVAGYCQCGIPGYAIREFEWRLELRAPRITGLTGVCGRALEMRLFFRVILLPEQEISILGDVRQPAAATDTIQCSTRRAPTARQGPHVIPAALDEEAVTAD